jgi:hypothetical protein
MVPTPDIAALRIYHSINELEHTRVSFDVARACLGSDGVPSLLRNAVKRLTGYIDGDVTRDRQLQDEMTDKMRWQRLTDMVEALACPSMRGARIRDLYNEFMGAHSVIFSAGEWYHFFDPNGWHPPACYDEDARLIEYFSYLRREGFIK